uniref:Galectin n=1 Tax=Chrysemys picta bellii TaxID=8478 RepID=A0A8C3I1T3_CHRPI
MLPAKEHLKGAVSPPRLLLQSHPFPQPGSQRASGQIPAPGEQTRERRGWRAAGQSPGIAKGSRGWGLAPSAVCLRGRGCHRSNPPLSIFSLSLPISQPLPHAVPIAGGLRPGMSIYVQGMVPHHTKRFRVNFSCGPEKGADIALHFNPRFDSGDKIVLNSFQRGKWAKEEHKHDMPFHKGQHFEMVFNITPEGYRITVNGAPCYEFRHRIPPEQVQVVDVDGDLELQSLNVIGGGMMGGGVTSLVLCLPSFCINFKMGYSKDIALHINPRLNERSVVRNSLLNGNWGSEERELPHNPFQPGQYFELSIRCGNGRFKVFANGQPLFDYNHRFREFQKIDTLEINGDVVLSYVQF